MSTERPETPDEARQIIRDAAGEVSRQFNERWLEAIEGSSESESCKAVAEAFEALWQELER